MDMFTSCARTKRTVIGYGSQVGVCEGRPLPGGEPIPVKDIRIKESWRELALFACTVAR
jgi:hypothetical protein